MAGGPCECVLVANIARYRKDPGLSSVEASVGQRRQGFQLVQLSQIAAQRNATKRPSKAVAATIDQHGTQASHSFGGLLWAVQLPLCRILTDGGTLLWQKYLERKALK